jgi:hypothetical protein
MIHHMIIIIHKKKFLLRSRKYHMVLLSNCLLRSCKHKKNASRVRNPVMKKGITNLLAAKYHLFIANHVDIIHNILDAHLWLFELGCSNATESRTWVGFLFSCKPHTSKKSQSGAQKTQIICFFNNYYFLISIETKYTLPDIYFLRPQINEHIALNFVHKRVYSYLSNVL